MPLQALTMPHIVSHASSSLRKALIAHHACIHLNRMPDSDPTCETRLPGSPGLACGAACPCKHSQCRTLCHTPPLLCGKHWCLAMPAYIFIGCQSLTPPVRPVCPEAPVWPVEPLAPASTPMPHIVSHACPSPCMALIICHVSVYLNDKPDSEPTCETCLPGSPSLACGAACPCKHSQCLTVCHMTPLLCAKP